jgi:hypothetical protein
MLHHIYLLAANQAIYLSHTQNGTQIKAIQTDFISKPNKTHGIHQHLMV